MRRHLAFLFAAAALAACCAAAAPPGPAAATARRALRQQGGCGDCVPDYSLTVQSKGGCVVPFCLFYTDRRSGGGRGGCWDARPARTALAGGGAPVLIDPSRSIHYETDAPAASTASPTLAYRATPSFCLNTCQVAQGYEATFVC